MASEKKSVTERINELMQQQKHRGERVETPSVTFLFPYLSDQRFQKSPVKNQILELDIPEITITTTKKAVEEFNIRKHITLTTLIPSDERDQWYIIRSLGIGGHAVSSSEVRLYFDSTHSKVVESLRVWKAREVAHELNHVARYQSNRVGTTLLDSMIAEGLATYTQEHWEGEYLPTPWGHKLSAEELYREWRSAQPILNTRDYNYSSWFFGRDGTHPMWTGYSLGTRIVEEYFRKHPRVRMSAAVKMDSRRLLRESGYADTLK